MAIKFIKKILKKLSNRKYRVGVFIVVYRKNGKTINYLLLKRKLHWKGWEFPKGGKKAGESDFDTIKRELKEETGLKFISIQRYGKKGRYKYDKKALKDRNFYGQTYVLYSARVKSEKVKIDRREHTTYKWVGFHKAISMLTWMNQKESLYLVNEKLTQK